MKKILTLILALCCVASFATVKKQAPVKKQALKVLFVGGSSDYDVSHGNPDVDSITVAKNKVARQAAFVKMFKLYFTQVTGIDAKDYKQEMSKDYDVTVFDAKFTPISKREYTYDDKGQINGVIPPVYFTNDFDCAFVTIAEMGEDLGRSLGSKIDWYCLCLEDEAHNWNKDHAVFQGPFEVKPETYMAPTPAGAQEYAQMHYETLPAETEMFRVNTEAWNPRNTGGSFTHRIGMVSRPNGFGDPDDEVISSGVCAKSIDAVAIGRHANHFHWGFAASPDYLTPVAKNLLANCVFYAAKFKGQRPIARKIDERIDTRSSVASKKFMCSMDVVKYYNQSQASFKHNIDSVQQQARLKAARGEKLSAIEAEYKDIDLNEIKDSYTFAELVGRHEPQLYKYFGDNTDLYVKYYEYNAPYLYCDGGYELKVDQECRELHMANNDQQTLNKCIAILEDGKDARLAEKAKTILERYTLCRFQTAKEWRQWYNKYQQKLFFSEGGMFKWLVNEQGAEGNDYSVLKK